MPRPLPATIALTTLLLASAFAGFANGGVYVEPSPAHGIEKKDRCQNAVSCLALNIVCYGEYRCKETNNWGVCVRGECIPDKKRGY